MKVITAQAMMSCVANILNSISSHQDPHQAAFQKKNYQNLQTLKSLDYVLLFLPVEAAFTLAIQEDERLFTEAFEQNIILVGPSTLLATCARFTTSGGLNTRSKNAMDIAKRADRFTTNLLRSPRISRK